MNEYIVILKKRAKFFSAISTISFIALLFHGLLGLMLLATNEPLSASDYITLIINFGIFWMTKNIQIAHEELAKHLESLKELESNKDE